VVQSNPSAGSLPTSVPYRPALVVKLRGIILQSDKTSVAGAWIIRPVEMLDLHLAGLAGLSQLGRIEVSRGASMLDGGQKVSPTKSKYRAPF
jgi:hypothetical protein